MFRKIHGSWFNTVSFGAGGLPLLAVGGWIGTWQVWRSVLEILSAERRCIAYDHRGAGQTVFPREELHPEGQVDDVFRVLDALEIDRCWLAGESNGGIVAILAALRDPSRFEALSLIGSAPFLERTPRRDQFAAALERAFEPTLQRFVDLCIPEPDSDHLKRWLVHILREAEPEAGPALIRSMNDLDVRDRLGELVLPTQVIHGDLDRIELPEGSSVLASGIPDAELMILPGVGHVPTITRPEAVAAAMAEFIVRRTAGPDRPMTIPAR